MTVALLDPAEVDPLAPSAVGVWQADGVRVLRRPRSNARRGARFTASRDGAVLTVRHDLTPHELNDELAVLLTEQLGTWLRGRPEFEQVFTGVVRSTVDGGMAAWLRFYRNSVAALEDGSAAFAPIHRRAAELVVGARLIDLGSCFGFFPLRMRRVGVDVLATDLSGPTMDLLDAVSHRLQRPVRTLRCDAGRVPLPDHAADTVTALHLLEHLDEPTGDRVLAEALRLARRRVVVAVPFEEQPQACYGHIRRFDIATLRTLGERLCAADPSRHVTVFEHHGGWLVLDRR
ncbi:type 11 methyltransferase [Mycolicibacterium canariasense]|uniref:Type 11 methyltransferase n=1 Tax=Mycolicibacterium canariasense TaxID=228230 RepID=A0A100WIS8_MYCCR|nr:mycofactocin oligosaccharide methyltransferase MftM [Mycolicibacterium canariasense]MCV7208303.1 class I SAM-dependent methyltransferase [Mycolicibacterium canariasense]ORV09583.1 SAM-dependent methyltransferase [Mycolicibacterium canariasense]GAS98950.1 type 11 methyltransferase [Mycolicibacterium canariasense]